MDIKKERLYKFDLNVYHRRSIRLKGYDYSLAGAYFVTMVTKGRQNLFGEIVDGVMQFNHLGYIIMNGWQRLPKYLLIQHDEWVIMPNHLHRIIWILENSTGEASTIAGHQKPRSINVDASPQQRPIGTQSGSLGAIIQNFKSVSTRKINRQIKRYQKDEASVDMNMGYLSTYRANASPQQVWQRNYYEHIIRNQRELDQIRLYIADNPRRWAEDEENIR